jgi:hypothetical protein
MKTIIAGSRTITDFQCLEDVISNLDFEISAVVSGTANGVDKLGERWAQENNIELLKYPANWDKYGQRAGYLRNVDMSNNADACIILWDGKSKGADHMYRIAKHKGLVTVLINYRKGVSNDILSNL